LYLLYHNLLTAGHAVPLSLVALFSEPKSPGFWNCSDRNSLVAPTFQKKGQETISLLN
jgi:hypothetical protein